MRTKLCKRAVSVRLNELVRNLSRAFRRRTIPTPSKPIYEIKLIIESDDPAEVERVATQVAAAACPAVIDGWTEPHECAIPYMLMTTLLSEKSARAWRDSLNR